MLEEHDFNVTVTATGAKTGVLSAPRDRLPEMEVASTPEFGGPLQVWSPEHLFVASLASCLMTTFQAMAANSGVEVLEYRDESTGHLHRADNGLYSIDRVVFRPTVVISPESRVDRAQRLLEKAEHVCLIGRSTNSETILEAEVLQPHQVGT